MNASGVLYVVSTPIGNLGDITLRAIEVLRDVDEVLAEDTRRTRVLLRHLGIDVPTSPLHEHNERARVSALATRIEQGAKLALVSDAGTPLISDPGFLLIQALRERALSVVPIPGVSALVTALSVAGLPTDRFTFEGFLPARKQPRRGRLAELAGESRTMVFYETPHRIAEALADMAELFGPEREIVLARELTKRHEQVVAGTASELRDAFAKFDVNGDGVISRTEFKEALPLLRELFTPRTKSECER